MTEASRQISPPAPPPWADCFRSDDLDEVRQRVTRMSGEHSRVVHGGGPLGFELSWLSGTTMTLGWSSAAVEKTIRGVSSNALVHLPMTSRTVYRFGRSEQLAGADEAVLIAPRQEFTRRTPPGQTLSLMIDAGRIVAEVSARVTADGRESLLRSGSITLGAGDRATLLVALGRFVRTSVRGGDPRSLTHSEAHVVGVVAGLLLGHDAVIRAGPVTGRRIGDLEDWIESHLDEPITLGRLCRVAGIGGRALAKTFESHRGMSPMRYVTERRLAAVHARLREPGAADEVTAIATELGFTHLGRFAIAYRKAFGESPSQTLRRGRQIA